MDTTSEVTHRLRVRALSGREYIFNRHGDPDATRRALGAVGGNGVATPPVHGKIDGSHVFVAGHAIESIQILEGAR